MTDKFSLQAQPLDEGALSLVLTSGTEIKAEIFDVLIKSGIQNLKTGHRKYPVSGSSLSSDPLINKNLMTLKEPTLFPTVVCLKKNIFE